MGLSRRCSRRALRATGFAAALMLAACGGGNRSCWPAWTLPLRHVASDLAVEDLDGDGRADYLVTGRSDTALYLTGPAGA